MDHATTASRERGGRLTRIDRLESELATLCAQLDSATHRQLTLIREIDALEGWAVTGARSFAHWLSWRVGLALGAAREKIRVASALGGLPKIDAALAAGELSFSKVRALTRVATADNEEALLQLARSSTAAQLERICRGVMRAGASPAERDAARCVSAAQLDSGLVRVTADLHADEAALVMQAVELARRVSAEASLADRADALVRIAESFIAGGAEGEPAARGGGERCELVVELTRTRSAAATSPSSTTARASPRRRSGASRATARSARS